jgi:hypothetical protein
MNGHVVISGWCIIRNSRVWVNGTLVFDGRETSDFMEFSKAAFQSLGRPYRKFYKMDGLCKLGFLCAEYLLNHNSIEGKYASEEIGIILSNGASCIDTDIEHQKTIADIDNYFPSPSIFVYTLPNIVIGEICIKHRCQGENSFFIFERFQPEFMANYVNMLFQEDRLKACLAGWVDLSPGAEAYEAVIYLAEWDRVERAQLFNGVNLKKIYSACRG